MQAFLFYTVVVALVAAFGLTLLRKWQVIEWYKSTATSFSQRCLIAISVCPFGRGLL